MRKNENNELINKAKIFAIDSIKKFMRDLDFEPELFNHLFSIDIEIGNTKNNRTLANYWPELNLITLKKEYISISNLFFKKSSSAYFKNDIILEIGECLIHEIIHANRVIMFSRALNMYNYEEISKNEFVNHIKGNNIIENSNKEETNNFFMTDIVSRFYLPYNSTGRIVQDNNLPSYKYLMKLKENKDVVEDRIIRGTYLEEAITRVITLLIIYGRDEKDFDLDKLVDKIIIDQKAPISIKVAAEIIRELGIDFLKWFITSVYDNQYNDMISNIFEEKYDELLFSFSIIYKTDFSDSAIFRRLSKEKNYIEEEIDIIDKILQEKKPANKSKTLKNM